MRDIHGVSTEIRDSAQYPSSLYPSLNTPPPPSQNPNGGGVDTILSIVVPTLKSIDAKGGKYRAVNKMWANPGRKEVEEGIEELKIVLAADGKWARESGTKTTSLDAYGCMDEGVDEANWPDMERAYAQVSGRKWERGHEFNIDHMEAAIRELIKQKFR